jgi:stage III sporulation protein AG
VNKIKDKINSFFLGDKKKAKIIVAVGLIGIVLIFASEMLEGDNKSDTVSSDTQSNYTEYTQELEERLTSFISSIDGVGECKVMITLQNTSESVYATNNEYKSDDDSTNSKDEYVFYDASSGETPVLIKEYMPQVQGVTVVCSGGDDVIIKEKIIESVTSLFNIPSNRVSVSKIKS